MNSSVKSAVVAGVVALVVAIGVLVGARALSPTEADNSRVVAVTPDGSVTGAVALDSGATSPVRASSGPPVPACSVVNTVLTCEGAGSNFQWHFPIGSGDSGIANEAFGKILPQGVDAGIVVFAKATITPSQTGEIAITSSLNIPNTVCDAGSLVQGSQAYLVGYVISGQDASAGTIKFVTGGQFFCNNLSVNGSPGVIGSAAGAVSGLVNDGGTAYDFVALAAVVSGSSIPDSSVGGLWVHETP